MVLIFAGKIIKDDQTLEALKITDGHAIHVVLKKGAKAPAAAVSEVRDPNHRPGYPSENQPSVFTGTTNPINDSQFGMSGNNFEEMQQQIMENPEIMQRLLDNPMVSSLMSDENVINEILTTNPQMRRMMEQNPDLASVMRNPDNIRQAMELFRNPDRMRQMRQDHDAAMRNINSIPGGSAALERMHQDIIQPMEEAMQPESQFSGAANAGNGNNNSSNQDTSTAPNPWAAPATNTNTAGNNTNASGTGMPQMSAGLQAAMRRHIENNPNLRW